MGLKCKILFLGHSKGTSLRETTLFVVLVVEIGAGVLAVGWRKNQKLAESLEAHYSHIWGAIGVIVSWWNFACGLGSTM